VLPILGRAVLFLF
jgi:hypothetical protein